MAQSEASNDWETASYKEEMVQLTNGKLWMSVQGPLRKPGAPIVVCIPGLGDPGRGWAAVFRRLSPRTRFVRYERAGLGRSDVSSVPRTAQNIAAELKELLDTAPIRPPYVLLGQSYGGIISRELLACSPKGNIIGMISVDSPQENTHEKYDVPKERNPINEEYDRAEAIGLMKEHKLTDEEAKICLVEDEDEKEKETGKQEYSNIVESENILKTRNQFETQPLSPYPITVIQANTARDFRRCFEYTRDNNIGTEEQRAQLDHGASRVEQYSGELQRQLLRLSTNNHFVFAEHAGHNVQLWDPQIMVDETLALLKRLSATEA